MTEVDEKLRKVAKLQLIAGVIAAALLGLIWVWGLLDPVAAGITPEKPTPTLGFVIALAWAGLHIYGAILLKRLDPRGRTILRIVSIPELVLIPLPSIFAIWTLYRLSRPGVLEALQSRAAVLR